MPSMASRAMVSIREVLCFLPHFSSMLTQKQPAIGPGSQEGTERQSSFRQGGLKSVLKQSARIQGSPDPATRRLAGHTPPMGGHSSLSLQDSRSTKSPYNPSKALTSGPAIRSLASPSSPLLSKSSFLFLCLPHTQPPACTQLSPTQSLG